MKKVLNVMIDLETLSLSPNAAIIQIATKPFRLDGMDVEKPNGGSLDAPSLLTDVDATTCAMYNFDFDKGTIEWWSKNSLANEAFMSRYRCSNSILYALEQLSDAFKHWKDETGTDEIVVWSQGTDFDIAVIRNAYRKVFGSESSLPWKYTNTRDARTYFLEAAQIFAPNVEKPYDLIKTEGTQHHALADVEWSIKAVQWAYKKFTLLSFILTDTVHRTNQEEKDEELRPLIDAGDPVMWELKKPLVDEEAAYAKYALPAGTKFILQKKDKTTEGEDYEGTDGYAVKEVLMPPTGFIFSKEKVEEYMQPFRRLSNDEEVRYEISDAPDNTKGNDESSK